LQSFNLNVVVVHCAPNLFCIFPATASSEIRHCTSLLNLVVIVIGRIIAIAVSLHNAWRFAMRLIVIIRTDAQAGKTLFV
jgi:hypothetical protein